MKNFFYPLVKDPYRNKDIQAAIRVVKSHKLNAGNQTIRFQKMKGGKFVRLSILIVSLELAS